MAFAMPAQSQEKKLFTPIDASNNNRSLFPQGPNQMKWIGDSDILMKVKGNEIITMTPGSKKEASFLTEEAVDNDSLKTAVDATGYTCLGIESAPYEKKGLFGRK